MSLHCGLKPNMNHDRWQPHGLCSFCGPLPPSEGIYEQWELAQRAPQISMNFIIILNATGLLRAHPCGHTDTHCWDLWGHVSDPGFWALHEQRGR